MQKKISVNKNMFWIGGLVSAFFASICCFGPLLFIALGVGVGATGLLAGLASFFKVLIPFKPLFIGLTFLFLGIGFYFFQKRKGMSCCSIAEGICASKNNKKELFIILTIALIAALLFLFPYVL